MTIHNLYQQLEAGKITKSKFLYEARRDQNLPWILNTTSYDDAIKILKNKSIIKESIKDEKTEKIVDRLNPYRFDKAVQVELDKNPEISDENTRKIRARVAKKLQKDPNAYIEYQLANAKEVQKKDQDLKFQFLKKDNLKDEKNQMIKVKGVKKDKQNTTSSTKENKKGKLKGVKELTYVAKKAKGIKYSMEPTGKEKILEALKLASFKKKNKLVEDFHPIYGHGQQVPLPKQDREHFGVDTGIVKKIYGGTLELELPIKDENGQPLIINRQVNVIDHSKNEQSQNTQDESIKTARNSDGTLFRVGETVYDQKGNELIIKGFKKEQNKIKALINRGLFFDTYDIDGLEPFAKKAFSNKPDIGTKAQDFTSKQAKLKELATKLKKYASSKTEKKSNIKESINEKVDMEKLQLDLKQCKKENPGKKITYSFIKDNPNGYVLYVDGKLNKKSIKKEATRFTVDGKDTYVNDQDSESFEDNLKKSGISDYTKQQDIH